ncbi:Beta-barrel assembly machine subunit BamE [Aliiroseovarius halocynthiae]|nr:Beta-barrel assembly machine subunit BamE [Aliiroseovarius halocynthiae]
MSPDRRSKPDMVGILTTGKHKRYRFLNQSYSCDKPIPRSKGRTQGEHMAYLTDRVKRAGKAIAIVVLGVTLTACSATYRNHGYMPVQEDVDALVVGKDTRETVAEAIGKPGTAGLLSESGYYYVRSRFEHYLYNAPKEIDRQILAISFDSRGRVENIERFGLENGRVVTLERRVTDSNIKGVSFLRQLFGSFGRIDIAEQFRGG